MNMYMCSSSGSGYSILSELDHQLSHFASSQAKPGHETLEEEDEKQQFFAELEEGRTTSLNYSQLNHQLGNTGTSWLV